eukprot:15015136-Alexandrium_andersonii.AAC.1
MAARGFGSSRLPPMPLSTASCSLPDLTRLTWSAARLSALRASPSLRARCWRMPGTAPASTSWSG